MELVQLQQFNQHVQQIQAELLVFGIQLAKKKLVLMHQVLILHMIYVIHIFHLVLLIQLQMDV